MNDTLSSDVQSEDTLRTITKETAFEGVNNYCHREYDWSVAKDNTQVPLCISMSIRQMALQEWLREFRTLMSKRMLEPLTYLII